MIAILEVLVFEGKCGLHDSIFSLAHNLQHVSAIVSHCFYPFVIASTVAFGMASSAALAVAPVHTVLSMIIMFSLVGNFPFVDI